MQTSFACVGASPINPIKPKMAIFHLSVKTISRSAGRSATAAAAYRAGIKITDERTGEIHDYSRKGGITYREIIVPENAPIWTKDRVSLWNKAELSEVRKNSTVAREFEIALPSELSTLERTRLASAFAHEISERHKCAVDLVIHAPGKGGDNRNHHAHILCSTRRITAEGFTEKTRELDDLKTGEITQWRERFATLQNEYLARQDLEERVDHRSHVARNIQTAPTRHIGVQATGYERRTGNKSEIRRKFEEEDFLRLERAYKLGELNKRSGQNIIDQTTSLEAALREREELIQPSQKQAEEIKIPSDYQPSSAAVAAAEHLRKRGIPQNKIRVFMFGFDLKVKELQAVKHESKPEIQKKSGIKR